MQEGKHSWNRFLLRLTQIPTPIRNEGLFPFYIPIDVSINENKTYISVRKAKQTECLIFHLTGSVFTGIPANLTLDTCITVKNMLSWVHRLHIVTMLHEVG